MIPGRDARVVHAAAQINTHTPWLVEFFETWYRTELERLPYNKEDFQVRQGRVQVLEEITKMFHNAEVDLQRLKT